MSTPNKILKAAGTCSRDVTAHVDLSLCAREPSHITLVGRRCNRDYVRTFSVFFENAREAVEFLARLYEHVPIGYIDAGYMEPMIRERLREKMTRWQP